MKLFGQTSDYKNDNRNILNVDALPPTQQSTRRAFTPKCNKCKTVFPLQQNRREILPPKRWCCPKKNCNGKLWQPDSASSVCDVCHTSIARFTRHHCRWCGYLTCSKCLAFHTIFAEWSVTERQRICCRCAIPDDVPVAMRGWMLKFSQRSAFFGEKSHMCYFELRGTVLLYAREKRAGDVNKREATLLSTSSTTTTTTTTSSMLKGKCRVDNADGGNDKDNGVFDSCKGNTNCNGDSVSDNSDIAVVGKDNSHSVSDSSCSVNRSNGGSLNDYGDKDNKSESNTIEGRAQSAGFFFCGQIDITGAKIIDVAIHPNAFCLVGPRLTRGCVFSAPSPESKIQWVTAIKEQVRQAKKKNGAEEFEDDLEHTEKVLYAGSGVDENVNVSMQDFDLLTVVGLGSFGRVMRVRHKATGNIYAMKIIDKEQVVRHKMITHTNAEKLILSEIEHPFVVKLYYAFQTKRHLILVLEFLCGGELFFHLQRSKRFSETQAKFYAAEIGLALEHIHSKNVLYRDLKPENLVLDRDGHVVLTDFGLAKRELAEDARTNTFCGTPEYMAPELVRKSGHTNAVDWWSLGVFLYEMVAGFPPFYSENTLDVYEMILHKPLVFPAGFSPELRSLLTRLLEKDPERRMTKGSEFRSHQFFKGTDFDKLIRREIKPCFVPNVKRSDVRYFDKRFLRESTVVAQLDHPCDPTDPVSQYFEGFDFFFLGGGAEGAAKEEEKT